MSSAVPKKRNLAFCLTSCFIAVILASSCTTSMLSSRLIATQLMSDGLWQTIVQLLSSIDLGSASIPPTVQFVEISFAKVFLVLTAITIICGGAGAAWISKRHSIEFKRAAGYWLYYGWLWWWLPGVWIFVSTFALLTGIESLIGILNSTAPLWLAVMIAGWLTTLIALGLNPSNEKSALTKPVKIPWKLLIAVGVYVFVFTAMNWQLYFGLQIPHGDSAMYEEHLWNLEQGKGFRSYLDQGLFLGEHIQVIHLLLIPLHIIWPSHLLLELCESLALGMGAIPIYWITRRHTDSVRASLFLSVAYLLYVPVHFLDIAIDLKTFRPISFGVPLMLFALDALERKKWIAMALFCILTLAAKEDFAIVFTILGLWIVFFDRPQPNSDESPSLEPMRVNWKGLALFGLSITYLALVILVFIPEFRSGENVHYARYFGELGNTPSDVAASFFKSPGLVLGKLFSQRSLLYALLLLLPLGCLPLLSPSRLAVAFPLGAVLCLLELTHDPAQQGTQMLVPFHHFHAPLIPIFFWAAAAGLGNVSQQVNQSNNDRPSMSNRSWQWLGKHQSSLAIFACMSAFTTGLFLGYSPLSIGFWDPYSRVHWRSRYIPGKRAEMFPRVLEQIPVESRVASTDQIHVRFTHHERSYDYSAYARVANDNQVGAPADTDYIVIDTKHRYATISQPKQIPEYRDHPDQWELLPDVTEGYFIILKRKPTPKN